MNILAVDTAGKTAGVALLQDDRLLYEVYLDAGMTHSETLMPMIGYLLGSGFRDKITKIDHWIAFVLLVVIGLNMIKESREEDSDANDSFDVKTMLLLAVATSIDALAVGVSFAFLQVNIVAAVCFIGCITFAFGVAGVKIGNVFGTRYKSRAELAGGCILILMGVKILIEHLMG